MRKASSYPSSWRRLAHIARGVLAAVGAIALLMLVLSFTALPFYAYHRLGTSGNGLQEPPDYIVVMGAGAMPGGAALMRCHYAALAAKSFPEAQIIITMPAAAGDFLNSTGYEMYRQMNLYGIVSDRFLFETEGTNTYTQACAIHQMLNPSESTTLLIVTSPEHVYRSVRTFSKCGITNVYGLPAFQAAFDNELLLDPDERDKTITPPGRSVGLRYNMWNYLKLEIDVLREYVAIAYYKIKGYI
jgi:uncharacterized SAM-binding protein YcdF (DUF218 family)